MPSGNFYSFKNVKRLLASGTIKMQQIDELVLPVLRTKLLFASKPDMQVYPKNLVGCKAHTDLAREVAEKSAVLLKNDNSLLPLDKSKVKRIAVIGSLADVKQTGDHGSSRVYSSYVVSPLKGLENYFAGSNVAVVTAPLTDLNAIKTVCQNADAVIIIAGTTYQDEGEYIGNGTIRDPHNPNKKNFITRTRILGVGGDREYLHLHPQDIEIIQTAGAANKNVVVTLVAGSAVTVEEWHNEVPAILETFYNGMEGGNALARILFGDVNPSGKLPFTVPKLERDLPPFDSYADTANYGYYHGYTLFEKQKKEPRYPFGFGLSYTSFQITDLKTSQTTDNISVSVRVKNTGARAGAEVVQLYVATPESKIDRPEKLLRAFTKVYLQPGEEKAIELIVPEKDLAWYNTATKTWDLEKGKYEVIIGNSSRESDAIRKGFSIR
jgi:beta-glucosidase